jgi:hypothetical protein
MAQYNIESLRKALTEMYDMGEIVSTTEQTLRDFQLVGQNLFTPVAWTSDTIENTWELENLYPMDYRSYYGSSKVDNTPTHLVTTKLNTPTKALVRGLDPERLWFMAESGTMAAQQVKRILEDGKAIVKKLTTQKELRNEIEVWSTLTTGTVTFDNSQTFQIPLFGVADDGGILCHDRPSWIDNTGNPIVTADIVGDIQTAVSYMSANGFDNPTTMWMNTTTLSAILANTKLSNTGGDQWWKPLGTANIEGLFLDWKNRKKIRGVGAFFPYGIKVITNDSVYRGLTGTATKFLPDNYVIFTGDTIGKRYITPNPLDHTASSWTRILTTPAPKIPQTLEWEVGESSLCFPDNRGNLVTTDSGVTYTSKWKSHYVLYVKAA